MMDTRTHLRLVLFDIDGTLLTTNGVARKAFGEALDDVFQRPTVASQVDFAGKTDQQIYYDIATGSGIDAETIEMKKDDALAAFLALLEKRIDADNCLALAGVHDLLNALEEEDVATVALLTGNMLRGAFIKLTPPGLNRYFTFGAFGNDARYRYQLPAIALERAYNRTGVAFKGKEVVIIGDTPNDIECGRHLNVRSIAVASGTFAAEELEEHRPDFLFSDLINTDGVLEAIFR
jgi:phosphoglycolate phosphatase